MDATVEFLRAALTRLATHLGAGVRAEGRVTLLDHRALEATDCRLAALAQTTGLSADELDIFAIAAAPLVDRDFEALFATVAGAPAIGRPAVGVACELVGLSLWDPSVRRVFEASGSLVAHRLVSVVDAEVPLPARQMVVPERVIAHLLGDDTLAAAVTRARVPLLPVHPDGAEQVARAIVAGVDLVHIREHPRASGRALASSAAVAAGRPAIGVDLARLGPGAVDETIEAAVLEAVLAGAILVIGPTEAGPIDAVRLDRLAAAPCPVVLHGLEPLPAAAPIVHQLRVEAGPPDASARLAMWTTILDHTQLPAPDDLDVISLMPIAPERALFAAMLAEVTALADDRSPMTGDLADAARSQSDGRLETLARKVRPVAGFDDLVVSAEVRNELERIVGRIRHQRRVLHDWGMATVAGPARGVTALFSGPSGTGKTLSAEVLAGALGVDLYVVDLSNIVDKYIGETEKNLERVFAAAEAHSGVLFFDEADALFGKRSETHDAHDRYANIEVAYLLQRIERFDGIAVLATNIRTNIDKAFIRRFDSIATYAEPNESERLALWRKHLPASLPLADDVDLEFLAKTVPLTGGLIRNICLDAAFQSAADADAMTMAHLVQSTVRIQQMSGRLIDPNSFGAWASAVDAG